VIASNKWGESGSSNVARTTLARAPAPPIGLTVTVEDNGLSLNWTDNSGDEQGFRLERSTDTRFGDSTDSLDPAADTTSYSDTEITAGETYYYRVMAFNAAGPSRRQTWPEGKSRVPTVRPAILTNVKAAYHRG
jgi:hypothetical protein